MRHHSVTPDSERASDGARTSLPDDSTAANASQLLNPPWADCGDVTALFVVNGLGMGNSTRCHAVIQRLRQTGMRIHVATSGNGLRFFKDKSEIDSLTPVESFFYSVSHNKLSAWRTLLSLNEMRKRASRKSRQLADLVERVRPDVCVTDSEYTLSPFRRRSIPVIALNNSDVVVSEYFSRRGMPRSIAPQFWLVEFMDYLFHRAFVDLVISPAARPLPPRHRKIRRVGLIVRHEVERMAPPAADGFHVRPHDLRLLTFMLSGSILGRIGDIPFHALPCRVDVVGQDGQGDAQVTYHGKVLNNLSHLAEADALVINGGFSAVSEALALRKPTLVIPVPRHCEQYINACQVADMGLGYVTAENEVVGRLRQVFDANAWVGLPEKPAPVDATGAGQAAEIIVAFLRDRRIIAHDRVRG